MKVLVIGAHPDDEAIGCGGAIILHGRAGDEVHSLFLTSGERGMGDDLPLDEVARIREQEAWKASQNLRTKKLHFGREIDGGVEASIRIVRMIQEMIAEVKAERVYAPSHEDAHRDHAAAGQAARIAVMARRSAGFDCEGLMYEVWTPLRVVDQVLDITSCIGEKIGAIRAHESQCRRMRFDDAAWALARYRGEMQGRPGGPFAEVFQRMVLDGNS